MANGFTCGAFRAASLMLGLAQFSSCAAVESTPPAWRAVIESRDWGPAVTTLVLGPFERERLTNIAGADNSGTGSDSGEGAAFGTGAVPAGFLVRARREGMPAFAECSVLRVAICDEGGAPDSAGQFIALALENKFNRPETIPMIYEAAKALNRFADIRFEATLPDGSKIDRESPLGPRWLVVEEFDASGSFRYSDREFGELTLTSAFRTATGRGRESGEKRPLIVWLHGAGEGGTDPRIVLLGNRVVNLASHGIQDIFGGADILAPQSPTFWMDSGRGRYTVTGTSKYARALMALIENHFATHPETDLSRVYLGGCSNGGFMTVKLIADNPGVFAAGWPVCEAYFAAWLSSAQAESLAATPLWFTHAKNDTVVLPLLSTLPIVERLRKAGARDVRLSLFPEVRGADGESYIGHFSWVYALKNQCVGDDGVTLMDWLAAQRL